MREQAAAAAAAKHSTAVNFACARFVGKSRFRAQEVRCAEIAIRAAHVADGPCGRAGAVAVDRAVFVPRELRNAGERVAACERA